MTCLLLDFARWWDLQARFKYPPHWIPVTVLFEAMMRKDAITGKPRGYAIVRPTLPPSLLFVCSRRFNGWQVRSMLQIPWAVKITGAPGG